MIGLPATCRKVVPTPSTKMQASNRPNPGSVRHGTSIATAFKPSPSNNSFFLPMRAASTPPGTLNTAKAMNTKNGSRVATTLLSW